MNTVDLLKLWKEKATEDKDLVAELDGLTDEGEINDRFYRDLEFGTGGLRGVIGAGTNRMNIYVVRRATQGLCNYLKCTSLPQSVAIAYDSRIKSDLFAMEAARVIAANGLTAYIYPRLEPTPALSWAVRYYGCGAGICVTASHNPAKYNGYKVYGADGCQITLDVANAVLNEINSLDMFSDVKICTEKEGRDAGKIVIIGEECIEAFLDAVQERTLSGGEKLDLKLVYTPLNGSGLECVKKILNRVGITDVTVVPEQEKPDGNFPTCPYPNPEIREAMECGLALCREIKPDLLLGTDPDCDRMGVAVPEGDDYRLITGNEMGVLLLDYICRKRLENGTMPKNPVAITTIVSTDMADAVANAYGVELRRVLTGFKFIGEQIAMLEADNETDRYIFGFEESYGYLSGSHVRDKDAVNASMLACEMTAWYKKQGMTLAEAIDALYEKFGFYRNDLASFAYEGAAGMQKMADIMDNLRANPPKTLDGKAVIKVVDYNLGVNGLPKSNVLEYQTECAKILVRPSGTEPKVKIYLSAREDSMQKAKDTNNRISKEMTENYMK
ncbi:MAG: phospho-sugar mutase [Acutalibacteraceae bacterium]|nr:phospho-sugar mutase [Acutalibacteraceae bacterium]